MDIRSINNTNPKKAMYYSMLRSTIASIYPYVDVDQEEAEEAKAVHYFFKGTKEECYFVSARGIFFQNIILGHLYFKEQELIYEENKIFGKDINYKKLDHILFKNRIVIVKNFEEIGFSYLYSNQVHQEFIDKIPSVIAIKMIRGDYRQEYYFGIGMDNTIRKNIIMNRREGI